MSHMAMPREGQLETMLHVVFAHLKMNHNSRLALDPTYPNLEIKKFTKYDWTEQYNGAKEPIPAICLGHWGKELIFESNSFIL